jgi:predicted AAA+ superfamily ATPase
LVTCIPTKGGFYSRAWSPRFYGPGATTDRYFDEFYYWASATGKSAEVDFLLERENHYTAIEVKASGKILDSHFRGLRACRDLQGLGKRILVYLGERSMKTVDGIEVWPFPRFVEALDHDQLWGC